MKATYMLRVNLRKGVCGVNGYGEKPMPRSPDNTIGAQKTRKCGANELLAPRCALTEKGRRSSGSAR
jgi:hypothetical protein